MRGCPPRDPATRFAARRRAPDHARLALPCLLLVLACSGPSDEGAAPPVDACTGCACDPHASTFCDGTRVWWVDGCGTRTGLKADCSDTGCWGGECRTCVPTCSGRVCGDDGCGGSCGVCTLGTICTANGTCCTPDCGVRVCGLDGCGSPCGTCPVGQACTDDGRCECIPQFDVACCKQDGSVCYRDGCGKLGDVVAWCPAGCNPSTNGCNDCTADCGGRTCGPYDGCGATCGTCPEGQNCRSTGHCCTADCTGRECGDDGCDGSCGDCENGYVCNPEGRCCTPECTGRECGDDGCGGTCGTCSIAEVCTPEGSCCLPQCYGHECFGDDGCGGTCGQCAEGMHCSAFGHCTPCQRDCAFKECGPDGCGGRCEYFDAAGRTCQDGTLVSCAAFDGCAGVECGWEECASGCGTCPAGNACKFGKCVPCTPSCTGMQCGTDGCGGSCGTCPDGQVCAGDRCVCGTKDGVYCESTTSRRRVDANGFVSSVEGCKPGQPCECGECMVDVCGDLADTLCAPTDQCCRIWNYYSYDEYTCCPAGTECCNFGDCCGPGEHCQHYADHYNLDHCIPDDEQFCGPEVETISSPCKPAGTCKLEETCCLAEDSCFLGCCAAGEECCHSRFQPTCCKVGDVCCGDGCCPKGTVCCGGFPTCCVDKAIGCMAEDYWTHCQSGYGPDDEGLPP